MKMKNHRINLKVVISSIIALICLVLMYKVDWLFIIPAIIIAYINQKTLTSKEK